MCLEIYVSKQEFSFHRQKVDAFFSFFTLFLRKNALNFNFFKIFLLLKKKKSLYNIYIFFFIIIASDLVEKREREKDCSIK